MRADIREKLKAALYEDSGIILEIVKKSAQRFWVKDYGPIEWLLKVESVLERAFWWLDASR